MTENVKSLKVPRYNLPLLWVLAGIFIVSVGIFFLSSLGGAFLFIGFSFIVLGGIMAAVETIKAINS